jgi:hypothetical protein
LPQNDNSGRPDWASQYFNVQTVLDGQSPTDTGETRIIGVANQCDNDRPINIYNTTHDTGLENTIVQNIGYFHPSKSGTYTFRLQNIDEGAYLWLGDKAKSGFTNCNADATANYVNDDKGTAEFQFPATAGEYVPFRALFANSVVCGQFDLQVTDPDGNTVISIDKEDTDGQFGFACGDNPQAPDFGF